MKESKTISVHLVISVTHPRFVQTLADSLLALPPGSIRPFTLHCPADAFPASWTVRGRGKNIPIHGDPNNETAAEQLRDSLQKLLSTGMVSLIPAGLTGAPHTHLSGDEILLEAEWAMSNPWKTGFRDKLGIQAPCFLPFWADPGRASLNLELLGLYPSLGLGTAVLDGYDESLILQTGSGLEFIPVLRLEGLRKLKALAGTMALSMEISRRIRSMPQSPAGKPGLIINLSWLPQTGSLLSLFTFIQGLEKHGYKPQPGLKTLPVSVLKDSFSLPAGTATLCPWGPGLPVLGPQGRQRLIKLSEVRQSRSSVAERVRSQLVQARPHAVDHPEYSRDLPSKPGEMVVDPELGPVEYTTKLPKQAPRGLISAMQGSATMMADNFSIRFQEGQIQAFSDGKHEIRVNPLVSRVMQIRGRQIDLEPEGSIAFESDRIRGLRHNLVLNPEGSRLEGKVSMDYVLSDRTPWLIMDTFIRYPWMNDGNHIQRLHPLGLELTVPQDQTGPAITLEWMNTDSEVQTLDMPVRSGQGDMRLSCTGNSWKLHWKQADGCRLGLAIKRMNSESRHPAPMVFHVQRKNGNLLIRILPEGEWKHFDAAELRGLHHHLSLGLMPLFDDEIPDLDPLAERDFDPFYLYQDIQDSPGANPAN